MATKTFIPTLVEIVRTLCKYITRYEAIIRENLPSPESEVAFEALKVACSAFILLEPILIEDPEV